MNKLLLAVLLCSDASYACVEQYKDNAYIGCRVEKGDKILNTKWLSTVENNYSGAIYQGISYFEVDSEGNYRGKTIIRTPNEDCVRYDPIGWTGKLYKAENNTYAAWNDGTPLKDGFYLINMSKDGLIGNSHLIGGASVAGISERNGFFKKSKSFNFDNVIKIYKPFFCK